MQQEIPLKWPPTIEDIVGVALSLTIIFFLIRGLPDQSPYMNSASSTASPSPQNLTDNTSKPVPGIASFEQTSSELPVRLKIPRINVDTTLELVGLTPEGNVGVPYDPNNAAWLDSGPVPGEEGSAVIDGHYGWKDGKAAVFDDLSKLQKGDKVYVEDVTGSTTAFVVRGTRTYGENENAADVFSSSDRKAHLNLITCVGVWNKTEKSYSNRLVVFTDKAYE